MLAVCCVAPRAVHVHAACGHSAIAWRCGRRHAAPAAVRSHVPLKFKSLEEVMGTSITFKRPDGKEAKGYLANA